MKSIPVKARGHVEAAGLQKQQGAQVERGRADKGRTGGEGRIGTTSTAVDGIEGLLQEVGGFVQIGVGVRERSEVAGGERKVVAGQRGGRGREGDG